MITLQVDDTHWPIAPGDEVELKVKGRTLSGRVGGVTFRSEKVNDHRGAHLITRRWIDVNITLQEDR